MQGRPIFNSLRQLSSSKAPGTSRRANEAFNQFRSKYGAGRIKTNKMVGDDYDERIKKLQIIVQELIQESARAKELQNVAELRYDAARARPDAYNLMDVLEKVDENDD